MTKQEPIFSCFYNIRPAFIRRIPPSSTTVKGPPFSSIYLYTTMCYLLQSTLHLKILGNSSEWHQLQSERSCLRLLDSGTWMSATCPLPPVQDLQEPAVDAGWIQFQVSFQLMYYITYILLKFGSLTWTDLFWRLLWSSSNALMPLVSISVTAAYSQNSWERESIRTIVGRRYNNVYLRDISTIKNSILGRQSCFSCSSSSVSHLSILHKI